MNEQKNVNPAEKKNSNGPFYVLLAITGLPFILALYFFYNPHLVSHLSTGNNGTLINPPVVVPAMQLNTIDGKTFDTKQLKDNWTLLMVASSQCDEKCIQNLFFLRQIRLAMGEDRSKIQRVMMLTDTEHTAALNKKLETYEGTITITGPKKDRAKLIKLLQVDETPLANRVFLVDPQGNLMMSYPANPPWKDVLKDLQHLLKIVQM